MYIYWAHVYTYIYIENALVEKTIVESYALGNTLKSLRQYSPNWPATQNEVALICFITIRIYILWKDMSGVQGDTIWGGEIICHYISAWIVR